MLVLSGDLSARCQFKLDLEYHWITIFSMHSVMLATDKDHVKLHWYNLPMNISLFWLDMNCVNDLGTVRITFKF
jgi:hypothetical protein